MAGTRDFAAPEQLTAESLVATYGGHIYSLGKLLYFITQETPPPLGSTEPSRVPAYLAKIDDSQIRMTIHRPISHSPADRFQSVDFLVASFLSDKQEVALLP